jgi:hypothetical protein
MKSPKQPLDLRAVRNSDFYAYWKRLKALGFAPGRMWHKSYFTNTDSYRYIRTFWTFQKARQRVTFTLSAHGYQLKVRNNDTVELVKSAICWSHLERPFLRFFKQDRPLNVPRLGRQHKEVAAWLQKRKLAKAKKAHGLKKLRRKTA